MDINNLLGGYTQEELQAAFNTVAPEGDWKAPIGKVIERPDEAGMKRLLFAIEFFTATKAKVRSIGPHMVLVQAKGYRAGPAGDH